MLSSGTQPRVPFSGGCREAAGVVADLQLYRSFVKIACRYNPQSASLTVPYRGGTIRGIVADCGFTSPGGIIRYLLKTRYHLPVKPTAAFLNVFTRIFAGFGLDQWSTVEAVRNTQLPILFIHGLDDHFVPSFMSEEAYEAAAGPKTLVEFPEATHGVSYLKDPPRYQAAVEKFVEENL